MGHDDLRWWWSASTLHSQTCAIPELWDLQVYNLPWVGRGLGPEQFQVQLEPREWHLLTGPFPSCHHVTPIGRTQLAQWSWCPKPEHQLSTSDAGTACLCCFILMLMLNDWLCYVGFIMLCETVMLSVMFVCCKVCMHLLQREMSGET